MDDVLHIEPRIPHLQWAHAGVLPEVLTVGTYALDSGLLGTRIGEIVISSGNHEAHRQSLQIPFPWGGMGFIEVVEIEDQVALRRGKRPKLSR